MARGNGPDGNHRPEAHLAIFSKIYLAIDALRFSDLALYREAKKTLIPLRKISRAFHDLGWRIPATHGVETMTQALHEEFRAIRDALKDLEITPDRPMGSVWSHMYIELGGLSIALLFNQMTTGLEALISSVKGFANWIGWQRMPNAARLPISTGISLELGGFSAASTRTGNLEAYGKPNLKPNLKTNVWR
jgi:hypothetical protein